MLIVVVLAFIPSVGWVSAGPVLEPTPGFQPSLASVTEAQKYAKYAASSLGFEDVPTAVKYLTDALRLLTNAPNS